ncbi:hypothetical protein ACTXT7_015748 [Hymenolepis weldensis]
MTEVLSRPRTIHNTLLPKDSTFSGSSSCAKKILSTGTAVGVRFHLPNGIRAEGIIEARNISIRKEIKIVEAEKGNLSASEE